MLLSIGLIAAVIAGAALIGLFRPEQRKQYNAFRQSTHSAAGAGFLGSDAGGAIGMSCGMDVGGCGGDGGGGGGC
jgi:hypothetical protein